MPVKRVDKEETEEMRVVNRNLIEYRSKLRLLAMGQAEK